MTGVVPPPQQHRGHWAQFPAHRRHVGLSALGSVDTVFGLKGSTPLSLSSSDSLQAALSTVGCALAQHRHAGSPLHRHGAGTQRLYTPELELMRQRPWVQTFVEI